MLLIELLLDFSNCCSDGFVIPVITAADSVAACSDNTSAIPAVLAAARVTALMNAVAVDAASLLLLLMLLLGLLSGSWNS